MLYNRRQFQSVLTSKGQKQGQNRRRNLIIKVVAINKKFGNPLTVRIPVFF